MNIRLSPSEASLQKWALGDQPDIDESVADDAAVQLARRDRVSGNFLAYLGRWVPKGRMTPVLFERFASAWEVHQHELMVAKMSEEVPLPDDLLTQESPGA